MPGTPASWKAIKSVKVLVYFRVQKKWWLEIQQLKDKSALKALFLKSM